jgi:hypothetical protein
MFLTSIGPNGNAVLPKTGDAVTDDKNTEFTKKLLEKAGIKIDNDKDKNKLDDPTEGETKLATTRSLSPDIAANTPGDTPLNIEKTIVAKASEWDV